MGALPSRKEEAGFLPREALLAQGRVWGPSCQPAAVPATRASQDWPEPSGVDLGPGAGSGTVSHPRPQQGVAFQGCGRSSGSSQGIPGPPVREQRPSRLGPELRPGVPASLLPSRPALSSWAPGPGSCLSGASLSHFHGASRSHRDDGGSRPTALVCWLGAQSFATQVAKAANPLALALRSWGVVGMR